MPRGLTAARWWPVLQKLRGPRWPGEVSGSGRACVVQPRRGNGLLDKCVGHRKGRVAVATVQEAEYQGPVSALVWVAEGDVDPRCAGGRAVQTPGERWQTCLFQTKLINAKLGSLEFCF